jgi:hypothetical protein
VEPFVIWWKWEKLYWLRKQIASMTIDADAEEDNWGNKVSFEHSAHLLWNLDPFRWDNGRLVAISVVREVGGKLFCECLCFVTSLALLAMCWIANPTILCLALDFMRIVWIINQFERTNQFLHWRTLFFFPDKKTSFCHLLQRTNIFHAHTHTKWCQRVVWSSNGLCSYLWAKTPLPSCQTFKQRANFKSCKSNSIWTSSAHDQIGWPALLYRASLHYLWGPKDLQWNSAFLNSEYAKNSIICMYVPDKSHPLFLVQTLQFVLSPIDICNLNKGTWNRYGVAWNQLGYMAINSGGRRDLWQNWWESLEVNNIAWLNTWGHVTFGFPTVLGTWVYSSCFGVSAAAVGSFGIFPKNAYLLQWSHHNQPPKFFSRLSSLVIENFRLPTKHMFQFHKSF